MSILEVQLRRTDNTQPWGMRLKGGSDQGVPLHVEHVQPNGRAAKSGVAVGDIVLAICRTNVTHYTHQQVKSEMLRAGNDLDLTIQRSGAIIAQSAPDIQSEPEDKRVEIVEEHLCKMGGPRFKQIKPKTYQILEEQLPAQPEPQPAGGKPSSIFDRKKEERSDYLHAKGSTIQKAFGEQQ